jgi:hypothetical protein
METRSYLTVKQLPEKYPAFTVNAIRWWIFNKGTNGFDTVVLKVGRRVLIDEVAFIAWLQRGATA